MKETKRPSAAPFFSRVHRIAGPGLLLGGLIFSQPGCAIRYHDAKTGTEHLWGFAHMKMRVAPVQDSPAPAIATQTETFGLGLHFGSGATDGGFALGWDRSTRVIVPDDTTLSVDWPTTDLFDVRLGRRPSFLTTTAESPAPAASK